MKKYGYTDFRGDILETESVERNLEYIYHFVKAKQKADELKKFILEYDGQFPVEGSDLDASLKEKLQKLNRTERNKIMEEF